MEKSMTDKKCPMLNEVPGFDPADYVRPIQDEDGSVSLYLEVKDRILWFRLHQPEGKIVPEVVNVTETSAVVRCRIYANRSDPEDQFIAQAFAQRFRGPDKFGDRFLEIAETAATGRALAAAGYGTQFCGSADMLSGIISDAPIALPEEAGSETIGVASSATHQLRQGIQAQAPASAPIQYPQPMAAPQPGFTPFPAQQPQQPVPQPPVQPMGSKPMTAEELMATMTLEDAKNVKIDFGKYAGSTLGQIAMIQPADLEWYVRHYAGKNIAVKAGATLLLNAAQRQAS